MQLLNLLIKQNSYSTVETLKDALDDIDGIENKYGGATITAKIASQTTKIFIENDSSDEEKQKAIDEFNNISRGTKVNNWQELNTHKEKIYTYYEYIQFKRGIYKCTNVEYEKTTGRITRMEFEFTGKIQ